MKYPQNLAIGAVFLFLGLALGSSGVDEVTPAAAEPQPQVMPEPAAEPVKTVVELPMEAQQCVDGSCGVSSTPQSASGPMRRVFQRRPLRRVLGRLFGR